jgi:alkaline phosphatase D
MKTLLYFLFLVCSTATTFAQHGQKFPGRSTPTPILAPFFHGVASGDPTSDAVVLWTRVTSDSLTVDVTWRIALDTGMTQIIDTGIVTADASRDYCVKVDVGNLQPFTFYYYEFSAYGQNSIRGRTRTLPVGNADSLRFAVVSCSNYADGYFNAYDRITERNDVFAVIHLGDYIYEYGDGEFGSARNLAPATEILTLADYRMRHSHYKLDDDLLRLHQQYPFYTVWDDHETANNAWFGGAGNHDPSTEGDWFLRRNAGVRAYMEWMPIRQPDMVQDTQRIYRSFDFGNLLSLHMLDTRLQGRDEQDGTGNNDPNRTLLGATQYQWLTDEMGTSTAKWQVLGQQVMMGRLGVAGIAFNDDQWDGYPAERTNLYNFVLNTPIRNMVTLTGDIHTSWAMDLPFNNYNPSSGAGSAGVEFVVTSVTSQNLPFPIGVNLIQLLNNHIKWANLVEHGYMIFDVNQQRVQCDWYFVDRIDQPDAGQSHARSFVSLDQSRRITSTSNPTVAGPSMIGVPAPPDPRVDPLSGITESFNPTILGAYPNPFLDFFDLQYNALENVTYTLLITNAAGQEVHRLTLPAAVPGINRVRFSMADQPNGVYQVTLMGKGKAVTTKLVKF